MIHQKEMSASSRNGALLFNRLRLRLRLTVANDSGGVRKDDVTMAYRKGTQGGSIG